MRQVKYVKRHRMELELRHPRPPAELPAGYYWLPWNPQLADPHARVLAACFAGEPDADVFPCLASPQGCRDLMAAITSRPGFCPVATWRVAGPSGPVGTIQGLLDENGYGGVQNLGVAPAARGAGLGRALLLRCLDGFAAARVGRAFLEVTAANAPAVRVYRALGFRSYKTIYREVVAKPPVPDHLGIGI